MNYWLISDTHFAHEKLDAWGGREGDWQDKLWRGIRSIPSEDVLIHLGDVCIGDDVDVHAMLSRASCKKVLVRGNHDKKSVSWCIDCSTARGRLGNYSTWRAGASIWMTLAM
jgi:calcineurin-like phosphoesterase family protein